MKVTGDEQSHMVIGLLMLTKGLCFFYLPQRQNYKATQCHSEFYIFPLKASLCLLAISVNNTTGLNCVTKKQLGLFFFFILSFLCILVSGIKSLSFALKISYISSASLSPFQKFGTVRIWNTQTLGFSSHQCTPVLHISGVRSATNRSLLLTAFTRMPICK